MNTKACLQWESSLGRRSFLEKVNPARVSNLQKPWADILQQFVIPRHRTSTQTYRKMFSQVNNQLNFWYSECAFLEWCPVLCSLSSNRAAELAGERDTKLIMLPGPTSLCHSCLSLSSTVITLHSILRRENSCLVTTLHFIFNPLALPFRVIHAWCTHKDSW